MMWAFLNGEFLLEDQACIPITDRGFLFGDGIFTTLRVSQGDIEFFQAHLQRLLQHCQQLKIHPPRIEKGWLKELILRNQALEGTWRLKIMITGGGEQSLCLPYRNSGQLLMTLKPYAVQPFTPCRLCLFPDPIYKPFSSIKTLAYLDRLFVSEYGHYRGFDDAIVLSHEGYLVETAFSNLFWIEGNNLCVPDLSLPYLKGIFLSQVIEQLSFNVQFCKQNLTNIASHANVYMCNSLAHIRPIIEIEGRSFRRNDKLENHLKQELRVCSVF